MCPLYTCMINVTALTSPRCMLVSVGAKKPLMTVLKYLYMHPILNFFSLA